MKNFLSLCILITISIAARAQTLADDDISLIDSKWKTKEFYKDSKRVYINSFLVYCEVYREDKDTKQGGNVAFSKSVKGSASVVQTLGLSGIEAPDLQRTANQLYTDFVNELKNEGFEIISADEAGKTKTYEGWQLVEGPVVKDAGLPGLLSIVPEGYGYFIKGVDKKGADVKSSKLLKKFNSDGNNGAFSNIPGLSKELDDAIVVDVRFSYLFTQEGDNWLRGNSAQVIVKTNFRLGSGTVSELNDSKSLVRLGGAETVSTINTYINFSKGKFSTGAEAALNVSPKKNIYINDVINSERITSSQSQNIVYPTSFNSYQVGNDFYTSVENRKSSNSKWIEVDSKKYADGMYLAGSTFMKNVLEEFKSNN